MDLTNVLVGWGTWLGALKISEEAKKESERRLKICGSCEFALPSTFLAFINGNAEDINSKYCSKCKCPCEQKAVVKNEDCPENKW